MSLSVADPRPQRPDDSTLALCLALPRSSDLSRRGPVGHLAAKTRWARLGSNQRPLACKDCHHHSPAPAEALSTQVSASRGEQQRAGKRTTEQTALPSALPPLGGGPAAAPGTTRTRSRRLRTAATHAATTSSSEPRWSPSAGARAPVPTSRPPGRSPRRGSSATAPLPVTWQATITACSPRSAGRVARVCSSSRRVTLRPARFTALLIEDVVEVLEFAGAHDRRHGAGRGLTRV